MLVAAFVELECGSLAVLVPTEAVDFVLRLELVLRRCYGRSCLDIEDTWEVEVELFARLCVFLLVKLRLKLVLRRGFYIIYIMLLCRTELVYKHIL
jgi:hypothetical protein